MIWWRTGWSEPATDFSTRPDLDNILRFSIEAFGALSAGRYFDLIERTIARLCDFPNPDTPYPGITPLARYASVGSHRIFYMHNDDRLTVQRVLHQAMRSPGRIVPR